MMDRIISFDFDISKIIIQELASVHATSLAIKLTEPNVFFKHVRPFNKGFRFPDQDFERALEAWEITLKEDPETCILAPRILAVIKKRGENISIREPLATLAFCDLWLNNIMVKRLNEQTHSIKFIDFQFPEYKSPVADLLYFLFTSVKTEVLDKQLDFLLEYYYKRLTEGLSQFNCEIPSFTFEDYLEEIRTEANQATVYQISFAILAIFASKENAKEGNEFDEKPAILGKIRTLQKEKICFLAKEFTKRNWV